MVRPDVVQGWRALVAIAVSWALALAPLPVLAQSPRQLAPGFTQLPAGAKVVLMPVDVELFSLSAGGVPEPKADWTADAQRHLKTALQRRAAALGIESTQLDDTRADAFAEHVNLHAAVARSIAVHHVNIGPYNLPTKNGVLDWSFGDSLRGLQEQTGARYALFIWMRDSYASAERKAAMVAMLIVGAALGTGILLGGGTQTGYASLVDLESGQVVWFNQLVRGSGDLREEAAATETFNVLMAGFPRTP